MRENLALRKIDFRVGGLPFAGTFKFLIFILHVSVFLFIHMCLFIFVRNEKRRLRLVVRSNAFHAGLVLKYLGIETFHDESEPVRGKLIICNHMSWLDALVLFTLYPALFITSREIEKIPVLGQITKLGGCFFIERRKELRTPESVDRELALMRKRLSEGFNIFLFPEGTSSDGSQVLPFKAHFFQLAIDNNIWLQPLVIKYLGSNRKLAPWYGDMDFVPHFLRICREKNFSVCVQRLTKISPQGKDRFSLKDEAWKEISEAYESH